MTDNTALPADASFGVRRHLDELNSLHRMAEASGERFMIDKTSAMIAGFKKIVEQLSCQHEMYRDVDKVLKTTMRCRKCWVRA